MTTRIITVQVAPRHLSSGIAILELKGSIHAGPDCKRVEDGLEALIHNDHPPRVVFDLTGVTHIDSAAIGMIVMCFSRLKKRGGTLCLAGATGMVAGSLKLTQIQKVIGIYPTASAAADSLTAPKAAN